jgi:hypothetical protein
VGVLEVDADELLGLPQLAPESDAAALKNAQFEDVPWSKLRATGPEPLVLIEHASGLVKPEGLIAQIPWDSLHIVEHEHQISQQNAIVFPYKITKHVRPPGQLQSVVKIGGSSISRVEISS